MLAIPSGQLPILLTCDAFPSAASRRLRAFPSPRALQRTLYLNPGPLDTVGWLLVQLHSFAYESLLLVHVGKRGNAGALLPALHLFRVSFTSLLCVEIR